VAKARAVAIGLAAAEVARLCELGEALNYNGYGDTAADVLIHPRELYLRLRPFADPADFAADDPIVAELVARRADDLARAAAIAPHFANAVCAAYVLPDAPWSRRVIGTFAHRLANENAQRMHAIFKRNDDDSYTVSVRASLASPRGADVLCRQFQGGGRAAAAGIDRLPVSQFDSFLQAMQRTSAPD
jgi:hypothetical protein